MKRKIAYIMVAALAVTGVTSGIAVSNSIGTKNTDVEQVEAALPNDTVMEYANQIELEENVITVARTEDILTEPVSTEQDAENETDDTEYSVMYGDADSEVLYPEWKDAVVVNISGYVRVRKEIDDSNDIVGRMYDKAVGTIVEAGDNWTKVTSGNVTGYINNHYLMFGDEAGAYIDENYMYAATVQVPTLNVREEADKTSKCIGAVGSGKVLEVVNDIDDEWVEIQYTEDTTAYVAKEFVEIGWTYPVALTIEEDEARIKAEEERKAAEAAAAAAAAEAAANAPAVSVVAPPPVNTSAEGLALGQEIANYACQFVGNPYVYGGSSLTNGTDCSGFTMAVYAQFGYSLPHASSAQKGCGTSVPLDQVQPGDIICYSGHVGMYIGGGQIVHAGTESTGIYITSMYYSSPYDARRIVQ